MGWTAVAALAAGTLAMITIASVPDVRGPEEVSSITDPNESLEEEVCVMNVDPGKSLAARRPELAAEWHPTMNGELEASDVKEFSNRKVWWQRECEAGQSPHEWAARIASRSRGDGCAVCRGLQIQVGVNDLASVRPELAGEWHPTRNGELEPTDVTEFSMRRVWWQKECVSGQRPHEWEATIDSRSRGRGCAVCRGLQVQVGVNDLATRRPELAGEWHPTRNGELEPTGVTEFSGRKVWWRKQCKAGQPTHEWEAPVKRRSGLGQGCAVCRGLQIQVGVNDLATRRPELVAEWHPTRNGELEPTGVTEFSLRKVWWQHACVGRTEPHVWRTSVSHRTADASGCPRCNESQGEKAVANLLNRNGVEYEREWPAPGLGRLRFDFALHVQKMLIEFDGPQHRQPVQWGSMTPDEAEAKFVRTQKNDETKNVWAKAHGWLLIRVVDLATVQTTLAAHGVFDRKGQSGLTSPDG